MNEERERLNALFGNEYGEELFLINEAIQMGILQSDYARSVIFVVKTDGVNYWTEAVPKMDFAHTLREEQEGLNLLKKSVERRKSKDGKFTLDLLCTYKKEITVQADNFDDAIKLIHKMYDDGIIDCRDGEVESVEVK